MFNITAIKSSYQQKHIFLSLSLSCALFFLSVLCGHGYEDRENEKKIIEKGINNFHINIRKLQEGISIQQELVDHSARHEQNLLNDLANLDKRLQKQLARLASLEDEMSRQQDLMMRKEQEKQEAESAKRAVEQHLEKRLKAFYKTGSIGVANVVFSSDTMPAILNFRESFTRILEYDAEIISRYRNAITILQQAKDTLNLEKSILDDFIHEAREKKKQISDTVQQKEELLSQIRNQKSLHQQAVMEMEKAAQKLSDSLKSLEKKKEDFSKGFLLDKGRHPAPVPGTVLARFGEQRENRLGIKGESTGIIISSPGVNRVKAIFSGEVRYADYLPGYGNTIIISHGYQYFSILSRLERLTRKKGDKVARGDTLGFTGETATLMDKGIHFEIRHGSTPLDPLEWINRDGLYLVERLP